MNITEHIHDAFWDPHFWLPPTVTWEDVEPKTYLDYTKVHHLWLSIPLAFSFFGLRYILENYCFMPLGIYLGVKNDKAKRIVPNMTLEKAYLRNKNEKAKSHKDVLGLAQTIGWSEREVERWIRKRRFLDKQSVMQRFCESCWRGLYYTFSSAYGLAILWNKPWFWDIDECYRRFPHQGITVDCWWYYMLSLGFYTSLTVSQFYDIKRKDFWQMFIHHLATVLMITFSWVSNCHRHGCLVLVLHDCSDVFLEAVKISRYARFKHASRVLFGLFLAVWLVTRCYVFPFYYLHSALYRAGILMPLFPAFRVITCLLCLLMVLHVYWTYLLLRIVYQVVLVGKEGGDIRSSSEGEDDEEEEETDNLKED